MITFNVGQSRITKELKNDIKEAVDENILEIFHRSDEFTEISKTAVLRMKEFLNISQEYGIIFTSSATESMQLVIQNCCRKTIYFC